MGHKENTWTLASNCLLDSGENRSGETYSHIFLLGSKLVKITSCSIFVGTC